MPFSLRKRPRLMASALIGILVVGAVLPAHAAFPQTEPNGQDTLLFVGDSLTVGTSWFGSLKSKVDKLGIWPTATIDAKVGRLATEGAYIINQRITNGTTAIVVALGTNDMISRRDPAYPPLAIDKLMSTTRGLPTLWFNVKFSPTGRGDWRARGRRFNRALKAAQSRWPNLLIADWYNAFTPAGPSRYIADGVHLSVSGYKTRATFTVNQLRQFGRFIVDSTSTTSTLATTTSEVSTSTSTLVATTSSTTSTTPPVTTT